MVKSTPAQKAIDLYEKYNPKNLSPFPIENILNEHKDLKIYFLENMDDNVSGVIIYEPDEKNFSILVNNNHSKTRQYFTIAHELGHYFLHKSKLTTEKIIEDKNIEEKAFSLYRKKDNSSKIETEANSFAAELIMPEKLVKEIWESLKDIDNCAEIFNVSTLAMNIRLINLKLIEA